jgi:hypothetical protein
MPGWFSLAKPLLRAQIVQQRQRPGQCPAEESLALIFFVIKFRPCKHLNWFFQPH